MAIVWGYDTSNSLPFLLYVGEKYDIVKQLFSSVLFKNGIKGIAIRIAELYDSPVLNIRLEIDGVCSFESTFSPQETKEYKFEMEKKVVPQKKIEVILTLSRGKIGLKTSSLGTGMAFKRLSSKDQYFPTSHLPIGLMIPV